MARAASPARKTASAFWPVSVYSIEHCLSFPAQKLERQPTVPRTRIRSGCIRAVFFLTLCQENRGAVKPLASHLRATEMLLGHGDKEQGVGDSLPAPPACLSSFVQALNCLVEPPCTVQSATQYDKIVEVGDRVSQEVLGQPHHLLGLRC